MKTARRILIVDDEPNVRLVFRTALESTGHELAAVEDGAKALEWLKSNNVDLILLDLQMPGMGGMEVLERLRGSGNGVPVIIVTAHGSIPDAVAAIKLGAIDFLAKPLTPDALRKAAIDVLGRDVAPVAEPLTVDTQFATNLRQAKQSINRRRFDEADVFLRQAIGLDPRSAEVHNLMGVLHESRGDRDESYAAYKAALKADRNYEPARNNMQRYYERFTFGRSNVPVDTGEE